MTKVQFDLWDCQGFKVIPVNVHMICGRGVAAQWKSLRVKDYNSLKGKKITNVIVVNDCILFPVKIHWYEKANLKLIKRSMEELAKFAEENSESTIYLPQVGSGFGERDWETEVKPIVEQYWRNNMMLVVPPTEVYQKYKKSFAPSVRKDRRFQK